MNYMSIIPQDVINGEGVRVVLFVSGCSHKCKGCQNEETWDENAGKPFTENEEKKIFELLNNDFISGITFTGGDPLYEKNVKPCTSLAKKIKSVYPNKDIWLYTGYCYEVIQDWEILNFVDVLIDGPFIEDQKEYNLKWRGSKNQRVIDIKETKKQGKIVLFCE